MTDVPPGQEPPTNPPPPPFGAPPPEGWQPPAPPQYQQYGYGYGYGRTAEYAGFWIRFAAALVDGILLALPMAVVVAVAGFDGSSSGGFVNPNGDLTANLVSTLVGVAYYATLEGGPNGQTLGKRLCGVRVVDAETGQPGVGLGRGIGRYFARWLSQVVFLLGYLWMLWDPKKQTWHDKLCRTIVVKA